MKQSDICSQPGCLGWMDQENGWYKCRLCGFMKKITKRLITP